MIEENEVSGASATPTAAFVASPSSPKGLDQRLQSTGGWQPINTAPKDGTEIDVWVKNFRVGAAGKVTEEDVGRYVNVSWGVERQVYTGPYEERRGDREGWLYADGLSQLYVGTGGYRVTHWQPLPEPPQ